MPSSLCVKLLQQRVGAGKFPAPHAETWTFAMVLLLWRPGAIPINPVGSYGVPTTARSPRRLVLYLARLLGRRQGNRLWLLFWLRHRSRNCGRSRVFRIGLGILVWHSCILSVWSRKIDCSQTP